MSESIPTTTPPVIRAGDRVKWTFNARVYGVPRDPADGWVLTYELRHERNGYTFVGSDNGDGRFLIDLDPATTATYTPRTYQYNAFVTLGNDRFRVDDGWISVEPDFAQLSTHDARRWAERMLEAVEQAIAGTATQDVKRYTIEGRSLDRYDRDELYGVRSRLLAEVARLQAADRLAKGEANPYRILVRM